MTLLEYATFICNRLRIYDSTSLTLCKEFVKIRYRTIWDSFTWRDSVGLVSVTSDTSGVMEFPAGIDRIMTIRAARDRYLVPTDTGFIIQVDPKSFESTGDAVSYDEFVDPADSNKRKIRFYPIPATATAILIYGKRELPQLKGDAEIPILRNIDNALIAFATFDMLESMRQYGKAQAKLSEAAEALRAMQALETQTSAYRPRVVPSSLEPGWGTDTSDWFLSKSGGGSSGGGPGPSAPGGTLTMLSDTIPLINAQDYIDVTFGTTIQDALNAAVSGANWNFGELAIRNTVDSPASNISISVVVVKTSTGFRLQFTAAPDSGNFHLDYGIVP